jgi:hypothetical protein
MCIILYVLVEKSHFRLLLMCCVVLNICDVWLTFIYIDAYAFTLVLIAILIEPFLYKDPGHTLCIDYLIDIPL